nr:GNAT family N-acetyltransferase [Desulfobulbaceae bacterium]
MHITPAQEEDISQIVFLENFIEGRDAASRQTLLARLQMFSEGFLVAKIKGRVAGYIETCIWHRETPQFQADPNFFLTEHALDGAIIYIIFVGVEERQRRHGIGSHLIREVIETIGGKFPANRVHAVSRDPILPFYRNLGFSTVKRLPGFLPDKQMYSLMEFCLR